MLKKKDNRGQALLDLSSIQKEDTMDSAHPVQALKDVRLPLQSSLDYQVRTQATLGQNNSMLSLKQPTGGASQYFREGSTVLMNSVNDSLDMGEQKKQATVADDSNLSSAARLENRKKAQEAFLDELKVLTSDECPKRHPFDFRPNQIAQIKRLFPEFKDDHLKGRKLITSKPGRRTNNKRTGIPLKVLKMNFIKIMGLRPGMEEQDSKLIESLMEKLDHKAQGKITWQEFLKFMDHEGMIREEVDNAQLYGIGVKRMREKRRINLKETPNQIEYYIDTSVCISMGSNFNFLLTLFENNIAKVFDTKTFKVVHEIQFPSTYAQPKDISGLQAKKEQAAVEQKAAHTKIILGKAADQSFSTDTDIQTGQQKKRFGFHQQQQPSQQDIKDSSKSTVTRKSLGRDPFAHLPLRKVKERGHSNTAEGSKDSINLDFPVEGFTKNNLKKELSQKLAQKVLSKFRSKKASAKPVEMKEDSEHGDHSSQGHSVAGSNALTSSRTFTELPGGQFRNASLKRPLQKGDKIEANRYTSEEGGRKAKSVAKLKTLTSNNFHSLNEGTTSLAVIDEERKKGGKYDSQNPYDMKVEQPANPVRPKTSHKIPVKKQQPLTQSQKILAKNHMLQQKYGRAKMKSPTKNMMFNHILGLEPLEEQEGSQAYFVSKDLEKDTSGYGIRFLLPDLYANYGKSKDSFTSLTSQMDKMIKDNDKYIKKMEPKWAAGDQYLNTETTSVDTQGAPKAKPMTRLPSRVTMKQGQLDDKKIKEQQQYYLAKKQDIDIRISKTKTKLNVQNEKLKSLKETNKHFYRMTSPSPYMVAQQQYLKRQLEKRGVDTSNPIEVQQQLIQMGMGTDLNLVRAITGQNHKGIDSGSESNYCTPEMMARYVEKLKQKEAQENAEKSHAATKTLFQAEQMAAAKKVDTNQTKSVYSLCATFNQELGLLALTLIDREVKIYKVKQNGAKVSFLPHISFHSKHIITCLCIERCVSNSRPILCMGSKNGEISIFYLDEPAVDPITGRLDPDGRVREKQHERSPFNFFKSNFAPKLPVTQKSLKPQNEAAAGYNRHGQSMRSMRSFGQYGFASRQQNSSSIGGMFKEEIGMEMSFSEIEEELQIPQKSQSVMPVTRASSGARKQPPPPQQASAAGLGAKPKKEGELTAIRYVRDIGLVCTSFNGTVKFFDAFNFYEYWSTANKVRKDSWHTNMTTFDISAKLGLMATGGAEGRIILIDPYALGIVEGVEAHGCEILNVYIFDEQQQIISVALDRSIGLWDASRLEKIEVIKDVGETIHTPKFSSSSFDPKTGNLFVGCQHITVWEAQIDQQVEIKSLQVQTMSKNILKERKMLDCQDPTYVKPVEGSGFQNKDTDDKTGRVLVTQASTLVDVVINQASHDQFLISVDSENLLRCWSTEDSMTVMSYRLPMQHRVTAVAIDNTNKYLAVGTNSGESKILNLKSGGVLYNLPHCNSEVTDLKFVYGMSEFWLFGACWGGKLMMWTQPTEDNNFTIQAKCKVGHRSDVLAIDCQPNNFIVTGGVDGIISIWNIFSGQMKYAIQLPAAKNIKEKTRNNIPQLTSTISNVDSTHKKSINVDLTRHSNVTNSVLRQSENPTGVPTGNASNSSLERVANIETGRDDIESMTDEDGATFKQNEDNSEVLDMKKSVVGVVFHPYYNNHICVIQESGAIHMVDGTNGIVSHYNVAKGRVNSSWACDPQEMTMFVIGDVGKACLFDISMGAKDEVYIQDQDRRMSVASAAFNKMNPAKSTGMIRIKSPPKYQKNNFKMTGYGTMNTRAENVPFKWPTLKPWYIAHKIKKMEPSYVVTAKFAAHAKIFISGTTHGEVKLWDNMNLDPLGVVNSPDWSPSRLFLHWKYSKQVEDNNLSRKQQAIMQPVEGLSGATPASRRSPQKSRRSQKNLGMFKGFEFQRN